MIGESYLGRCGALKAALAEMEAMARGLDLSTSVSEPMRELGRSVEEPFLIVVTGADGAGKSMLVNALAGAQITGGISPGNRLVYEYAHGDSPAEVPLGVNTIRRECSVAGLEKLRVVDMPMRADSRSLFSEDTLPSADAVLFVFSITNPWVENAWDFLKGIHFPCADRLICVLQQCDLRSPMEVQAVTKHIEQKMRDRFSTMTHVQPISASLALQARNGFADGDLLERSGVAALERRLSEIVSISEPRLKRLCEKVETAQHQLDEMASRILSRCHTLQRDLQRLATLERNVIGGKSDMVQHLTGALLGLTRECDQTQMESYRALEKNLGFGALLSLPFRRAASGIEGKIGLEPIREAIRRAIPHALEGLQSAFREVWDHFHSTLRSEISTRLPPAPSEPPPIKPAPAVLEQIEREAFIENADANDDISVLPALKNLASLLRILLVVIVGGVGAAIFFAPKNHLFTGIGAGVAAIALLVAISASIATRSKVLTNYRRQLVSRREAAIAASENQLHEIIEQFYTDMAATFEPLEGFCNARMHFFDPFLSRVTTLGSRLENLMRSLRSDLRD